MVRFEGGGHEIMTFYPTMEEFKDFQGVIKAMEDAGAQNYGIAKVVPPSGWKPRKEPLAKDLENIGDFVIPAPIEQNMLAVTPGSNKAYQVVNLQKKKITVRDYRRMALSDTSNVDFNDAEAIERSYWRSLSFKPSIYGADVSGSLTDEDVEEWNCAKLPSILDCLAEEYGSRIEGVNTPYLYFGMWKTTFAIHTEDMDLYSINYNHFGAPKFWYALSPSNARKFERAASQFFACEHKECPAYLRHKSVLFAQNWFKFYSIPFFKGVQRENEFMITFPMGYHWGFNTGLNIAESTNFATERWIEYGKRCSRCTCEPDRVNISMEAFVRRFQADRYSDWLWGRDMGRHPDASVSERATPAPPPSLEDLECTPNPLPDCIDRIEALHALRKNGLDPMGKKIPGLSKRIAVTKTSKRQSTAVLALEASKKLKVSEDEKVDGDDGVVAKRDVPDPDSFPTFVPSVVPTEKVEQDDEKPAPKVEVVVDAEIVSEVKEEFIGPSDCVPTMMEDVKQLQQKEEDVEQEVVEEESEEEKKVSPSVVPSTMEDDPVEGDAPAAVDVIPAVKKESIARKEASTNRERRSSTCSESRRHSRSHRRDAFPDSDEDQDPNWAPVSESDNEDDPEWSDVGDDAYTMRRSDGVRKKRPLPASKKPPRASGTERTAGPAGQKKPTTPTKAPKPKFSSYPAARPAPAPKPRLPQQKQPPTALKPKRSEPNVSRKKDILAKVDDSWKSTFVDPLSLLDKPVFRQ